MYGPMGDDSLVLLVYSFYLYLVLRWPWKLLSWEKSDILKHIDITIEEVLALLKCISLDKSFGSDQVHPTIL